MSYTVLCINLACIVLYFDVVWIYDHKTEIKAYLLLINNSVTAFV